MTIATSIQNMMGLGMAPALATYVATQGSRQLSELLYESAADNITAHSGGGQALAFQLVAEMNRITTAVQGDSVALPPSAPGLTILVENAATANIKVFGVSPDTINGSATAIGVTQMPNSVVLYTCYTAGAWFANGLGTGYSGSLETMSFSIVSAAGTTQAGATQLGAMMNQVSTVSAGQGVGLPASAAGLTITVMNTTSTPLLVYPLAGASDTINGIAATIGITLLGNSMAVFNSPVAGQWFASNAAAPSQDAFNTNTATAGTTLTAANVTGGQSDVALALTGALGGAANAQMPTVAATVLALHNPAVGTSYRLRIINESSGAFAWTVTTNTGWTLTGTMTIAQNTWREFNVLLTSLTTATLQNVGTGTFS